MRAFPRLMRFLTLSIVLVAVMVCALSTLTSAHTELEESTPTDGATLKKLPASGTLVFSEEVSAQDVTVRVGKTALPVSGDNAHPRTVTYDLRSIKAAKTIHLTWRAVDSHDGHETSGSIEFHVSSARDAGAPTSTDSTEDEEPPAVAWLSTTSRALGYLSMAVFVGGLLFVTMLWPAGADERRLRVVLATSVVAGLLATAGYEAAVMWRTSASTTVSQALIEDVGRIYTALAVLWVLAAVVTVAIFQRGQDVLGQLPWRVGALVVAAGLIRTTGMTSHVTQSGEPLWMIATDFVHLAAISAWVGGLTMVLACLLPRKRLAELEEVVPRFSKVALTSVLVIVVTGLVLLLRIITSVDGFWESHYAGVLILKLWLFGLVLLAATRSKRWVDRARANAVVTRRRTEVGSLALSVAMETVLVVGVLAAASVLVSSSPGA